MKITMLSWRAFQLAAVSILCSSWCLAQSQTATPTKIQVTMYQIKPDMVGEWEQFIKGESNEAARKAGIPMRSHWQTAVLGQGMRYTRVQTLGNFAALDEPSPLVKAIGQAEVDQLNAKARKMFLAAPHTWVLQLRADMSFPQELSEQHRRIAVLNHIKVMPGRGAEFERLMKTEIIPAMRKADVNGYQVYENLVSADPNEWHTVTYYNRFADFDREAPLLRALGQEGYRKLNAKTAGLIHTMEREVIRYRDDLSFMPAPQRASR